MGDDRMTFSISLSGSMAGTAELGGVDLTPEQALALERRAVRAATLAAASVLAAHGLTASPTVNVGGTTVDIKVSTTGRIKIVETLRAILG
jgi:hypothetical protein